MTTNSRSPQQSECDPDEPTEHFLWAVTQIPWGQEVQAMPPHVARVLSKHLYECGFRHEPALQTKKLQMPHRGQQSYLNGLARWVAFDEEDPEPVNLPDVNTMTTHEQELLIEELKNLGRIQDPSPDLGPLAQVTSFKQVKYGSDHITSASELLEGNSSDGTNTGAERT